MISINIIAVGKLKEKYFKDAVAEYEKRLSGHYCNLNIMEVSDKSIGHKDGIRQQEILLDEESDGILRRIKETDYVIALCIEGKQIDSIQLSNKIENLAIMGKSNICFVIGGSLGLSSKVKRRADFRLSFSKFTFPHQLMRIILLEQIYRTFKIQKNEVYHK